MILALVAGSLAITARTAAVPQNDDWSFTKSALILAQHGRLELQGWGQMFMLGQLITAQPLLWIFGQRTASLELYGALAMLLWLSCVYLVGRQCVGERRALLAVAVIACWPGMGLLASSFMTDGPSAAASLLSVVLGIAAIRRQSRPLFAGCLLAGLLAFTIREQMVVSVAAVALAAWVSRGIRRRFRIDVTVGTALLVAICVVLENLRHGLPNGDLPLFGLDTLNLQQLPPTLLPCLFTLGLALSPLAVWNLLSLGRRDLRDLGRMVGWLLGILALGVVGHWDFSPLPTVTLSNYVTPSGGFAVAVVGRAPAMIAPAIWQALQVTAMIGGVAILGEVGARVRRIGSIWRGWRTKDTAALILTIYTLGLLAFVIGLAFAGQRQFDRYLIPLFPGVGLLLLRPALARSVRPLRAVVVSTAVAAATIFLAVVSLIITAATNVRDAGVWEAASTLTARGVPATLINAGLDWDGYQASTPADRFGAAAFRSTYNGQHWIDVFPLSRDCYVVSLSPMKGRQWLLLSQAKHRPYGLPGASVTTYTYQHASCPPRALSGR